jgi:hypothetical protein
MSASLGVSCETVASVEGREHGHRGSVTRQRPLTHQTEMTQYVL